MIARASFVETFQELIGINWLRLRVDEGPVFNSNSVGRLIRWEQCLVLEGRSSIPQIFGCLKLVFLKPDNAIKKSILVW